MCGWALRVQTKFTTIGLVILGGALLTFYQNFSAFTAKVPLNQERIILPMALPMPSPEQLAQEALEAQSKYECNVDDQRTVYLNIANIPEGTHLVGSIKDAGTDQQIDLNLQVGRDFEFGYCGDRNFAVPGQIKICFAHKIDLYQKIVLENDSNQLVINETLSFHATCEEDPRWSAAILTYAGAAQ